MEQRLRDVVNALAGRIGFRSQSEPEALRMAAQCVEDAFRDSGCEPLSQEYECRGETVRNIAAEVGGTAAGRGILVIGAHYDTACGTPGADDNASGIACLLELARIFSKDPPACTLHLAAFTHEEPPAFMTKKMGSYVCAKSLKDRDAKVEGMISLEMCGYYCDEPGSQYYPSSLFRPFYPSQGDFIAFVGNFSSRRFLRRCKDLFRAGSTFPVESLIGTSFIPGVDFSDHRNFWKFGYPAFMVTDTAFYRNPNYHGPADTPDSLDYAKMAELVKALEGMIRGF